MDKVLVLGGSYFIGKKIVEVLVKDGYDVTILNRGTNKNYDTSVDTIICDRNDEEAMIIALKNKQFDIVVDVSGFNKMQVTAACNALSRCSLKKYIFISSGAVYAMDKGNPPYRVGDSMGANETWGDYGTNKIEAEQYLYKAFGNNKIQLIVIRPPYVYGENNYAQRESFIFDHIVKDMPVLIPGGGDAKIQFIYSLDLAKIVVWTCGQPFTKSQIFNVGNRESVTFNKWIALCGEAAGKKAKTIHFDYKRHNCNVRDFFPFYNISNVLATDLLSEQYSYTETPMLEGLKNAFEWYKENANNIEFKPNIALNEQEILSKILKAE